VRNRIAVVGAGAAGLSAAYRLRFAGEVTLYEASRRLGGHAHTVEVTDGGRTIGLDTAFIVFNEPNYPELVRLFDELGVDSIGHPGKFSYYDLDRGTCYVSDDFMLDEASVRADCPAEFLPLWRQARRFHAEAPRDFVRRRVDMSLGEYLDRNGYSDGFRYGFVVMLCSTAWVVPAERIWDMPAATIIAFFMAHGAEPLGGSGVPWRTVCGGSVTYVRRLAEELRAAGATVHTGTPVHRVTETATGVQLLTGPAGDPEEHEYDQVVLATHADQSLRMLADPTPPQRMLAAIGYHPSTAVLHTDPAVMPPDRNRWRSWNYGLITENGVPRPWVVYHLNTLHGLDTERQYFVSVNCPIEPDPATVIERLAYDHPTFTQQARSVHQRLDEINTGSRIKFAGSYFHSRRFGRDSHGNHDTAIGSGVTAAERVLRDLPPASETSEVSRATGPVGAGERGVRP
jgi:predicted NAD/FAD-binding protein